MMSILVRGTRIQNIFFTSENIFSVDSKLLGRYKKKFAMWPASALKKILW